MQLESHPIDQTSLTLFQRRSQQPLSSGQGNSFGSGRRPSTLGLNESAMMEDEDERSDALLQLSSSLRKLSGDISMSATFDPVLPSSAFTMSSRSARSRSASESASNHPFQPPPPPLFSNVPPSPVTVARALQAGQKTPPAMFQRRLFKDDHMLDDGSNSEARSSRSGSSSDVGSISNSQFSTRDKGKRKATLSDMLQDEDDEIEELSVGLSRSTSGTTDEMDSARVVRRPVSRKPNLLVSRIALDLSPRVPGTDPLRLVDSSLNRNLIYEFSRNFEASLHLPTYPPRSQAKLLSIDYLVLAHRQYPLFARRVYQEDPQLTLIHITSILPVPLYPQLLTTSSTPQCARLPIDSPSKQRRTIHYSSLRFLKTLLPMKITSIKMMRESRRISR